MIVRRFLATLSIGLTALAAHGAQAAGPSFGPSFGKDIAPLLKARCAVCHLTGKEAGNMALHPKAAWASLVSRPSSVSALMLVNPDKPDQSYMLMKLEGTHIKNGGSGARMPFAAPPLDPTQIGLIRAWIKAGAKNN